MTKTLILSKIFHVKVPLALRWALTYKCNQQCLYCGFSGKKGLELDTSNICKMIDEFVKFGTQWISFTGGEPLLRDDIDLIIKHAKSKDVHVTISSNGALVSKKISAIATIDRMKLSLDAPPAINDRIRGKGSFDKVMEAIELCKKHGIAVALDCALSQYNLDSLDYLINLASRLNLKVSFQPAVGFGRKTKHVPPVHKYRNAMNYLISQKKNGAPILNSLAGLDHLCCWPVPKKIPCIAGRLSFIVEPNGVIAACSRRSYSHSHADKAMADVKGALQEIEPTASCKECWSMALVEFNLIASFNLNAIINHFNLSWP